MKTSIITCTTILQLLLNVSTNRIHSLSGSVTFKETAVSYETNATLYLLDRSTTLRTRQLA